MTDDLDVRTSLAIGRGAVSATTLDDLLGAQGVPLPLEKGEQQALVIMSIPCCSHAATNTVREVKPKIVQFDTAEHAIIVFGLKFQTEQYLLDAARTELRVAPNSTLALTYGQLIALGGDFYGDPKNPVCTSPDPLAQFSKNFDSMAGARTEIQKILAVANHYEFTPIADAVSKNRQPSGVYAGSTTTPPHVVPDEDFAFDAATGGRYLDLALNNFDHFGVDAITCYTAGHRLAQQRAADAKKITDPQARKQALEVAYATNAFADHFLTDLFAAGHMRTPRRPLWISAGSDPILQAAASLCAKQMHDEDNKFGLWVTNAVGDTWVAYGDARYRDSWNAAGRVIVKAAVQQSMNDIWASFDKGAVTDSDASAVLKYTARLIRDIGQPTTGPQNRDDRKNWAPLFWWNPDTKNVWRRNNLFDPSDRTFCEQGPNPSSQWAIWSTAAKLIAAGRPVYMPQNMYRGGFPPVETGATGEYGWPPVPGSMTGPWGATGPTLRIPFQWQIDGAPGPTQGPPPADFWTPTSALANAVYAAGFMYDPQQDIIYSRVDALQRKLGYAYGYDVAAFGISANLDCEPIFFDYDGKHWMIELWKGQYGLMSGCEIGVYTRPIGSTGLGYKLLDATVGQRSGDGAGSHNLFYDCAADDDRLMLSATLHRDGQVLFTRGPEPHWWLTGFKWGVWSDPRQLSVDVSITLKDSAMCQAFMAAIAGRPYPNKKVDGTTVSFTFAQPYAVPQPPKPAELLAAVNAANQQIVSKYLAIPGRTNNDPNDPHLQAEFLSVAGLGLLRLVDNFGLAVCQLAMRVAGESISSVVNELTNAFGVAASRIEGWLSDVLQAFANWVRDIENYLGLPLDYSSYVEIDNTKGASDLVITGSTADHGTYAVGPPERIPKGTVGRLVLRDPKPTLVGTQGTVTYKYADASLNMNTVTFSYACPFVVADNKASSSQAGWVCFAKVEDANRPWSTSVPPRPHPLFVGYVTGGGQPS
jgi:Domain of unknown function (DUF4474)